MYVGLRRHWSPFLHLVSDDHNTIVPYEPGSSTGNLEQTVCGFPCIILREVPSSFHSKIGKDEEKIHLSIFSPLSQWHLRYAYLKQQMHRAHGTSSERLCEGIPAAGELLPPFLLHPFEPPNP